MISLDREKIKDIKFSSDTEWIITNGIGGYSSSTILGMNTRRYHGLLVSSFTPPVDRVISLVKVEEEVKQGGSEWFLSTTNYGKLIHPRGYNYISSFSLNPSPVTIFEFGENTLKKNIFMVNGENTVVISYSFIKGKGPIELYIYPMVVFRDYHSLQKLPFPEIKNILMENGIKIQFGDPDYTLSLSSTAGSFSQNETYYRSIYLSKEYDRGFDCTEDYLSPGHFKVKLAPGYSFSIIASTDVTKLKGVRRESFLGRLTGKMNF